MLRPWFEERPCVQALGIKETNFCHEWMNPAMLGMMAVLETVKAAALSVAFFFFFSLESITTPLNFARSLSLTIFQKCNRSGDTGEDWVTTAQFDVDRVRDDKPGENTLLFFRDRVWWTVTRSMLGAICECCCVEICAVAELFITITVAAHQP